MGIRKPEREKNVNMYGGGEEKTPSTTACLERRTELCKPDWEVKVMDKTKTKIVYVR